MFREIKPPKPRKAVEVSPLLLIGEQLLCVKLEGVLVSRLRWRLATTLLMAAALLGGLWWVVGHAQAQDDPPPGPPLNLAASPAGWTASQIFTLTWTLAPEDQDVVGAWYRLDTPPTAPDDGPCVGTTNIITNVGPVAQGAHPVYVWLQDAAGQADPASAATTILYVDILPPGAPVDLTIDPTGWTNAAAFSLSWAPPAEDSGVAGAWVRLDTPPSAPNDGQFFPGENHLDGLQIAVDGEHTVYVWLQDVAGNVDPTQIATALARVDRTPPVTQITLQGMMGAAGWYTTPVQASFTATDGDPAVSSGVQAIFHRLDGSDWRTEPEIRIEDGVHLLEAYARDVAGNVESTRASVVAIDTQPPTTVYTLTGVLSASGWYTGANTALSFGVSDSGSGPAGVRYTLNDGPWQVGQRIEFGEDGRHAVQFQGQDVAGNLETMRTLTVPVDARPPTTAYVLEGTRGDGQWFVSPVTVTLVPTDTASGVIGTFYRVDDEAWQSGTAFVVSGDGEHRVSFYSVDAAGNIESSYPVLLHIDTHPPAPPQAVQVSPSDWSPVNAFTVTWAALADLSGIAGLYYKIGDAPSTPTDGHFISNTFTLVGLSVPAEGAFPIHLWLRDGAGNVDHNRRTIAGPLRFDASPPVTTLSLEGMPGLWSWFRSPVTATLNPMDLFSGVSETHSRLDDGPWTPRLAYTLTEPGKHTLAYRSRDVAGNEELTRTATIRIDTVPPGAPLAVDYAPRGWTSVNDFSLFWRNPLDLSGVAGAYVRLGAPPQFPGDGQFFTGSEAAYHIQVPAEGQHDVYVWLRDVAGNDDPNSAVMLSRAFWYDATPPTTNITVSGRMGASGWYTSVVTVQLSATDSASGVADIYHQVGAGAWMTGTAFALTADGVYPVRVYAQDVAGNRESIHEFTLRVDQHPPVARITRPAAYVRTPDFTVSWAGWDEGDGSGVVSFDVQRREGTDGPWMDWRVGTVATEARFSGVRGRLYAFRVRARDAAGHTSAYSAPAWVTVESVTNGDFEALFAGWQSGGLLERTVLPVDRPGGGTSNAVRLGTPDYERTVTPINPGCVADPGCVPVGAAVISQTVTVPAATMGGQPRLSLWYRILTYDVMFSERYQRYYDTFEVTVVDGGQEYLVLRDGNPTQNYGQLMDLGWKFAVINLDRFVGRTVTIRLSNHNRWDNRFNTWTFVDDVQVRSWASGPRLHLPLVNGGGASVSAQAQPAPDVLPRDRGVR